MLPIVSEGYHTVEVAKNDTTQQQASPEQRKQQMAEQDRLIAERGAKIKHKIAIISGKGGVGKTTLATAFANMLAADGLTVGLLDTDITGPNVPLMMGIEGQRPAMSGEFLVPIDSSTGVRVMSMGMLAQDRDTPVIWRGPLRGMAVRQLIADVEWGALDYLIIDLPPGTGDEPLTVAQSLPAADGVVVVTTPQEVSLEDCRKAINFSRRLELPVLGVVENMSGLICPHCGQRIEVFGSGGGEEMAKRLEVPFLGRIPLAPAVVEATDQGIPLGPGVVPEAVWEALSEIVAKLPQ